MFSHPPPPVDPVGGFHRHDQGRAQLQSGLGFVEEQVPRGGDITTMSRLLPYVVSSSGLCPGAGPMEKEKHSLHCKGWPHTGAWMGNVTRYVCSFKSGSTSQELGCVMRVALGNNSQDASGSRLGFHACWLSLTKACAMFSCLPLSGLAGRKLVWLGLPKACLFSQIQCKSKPGFWLPGA